MHMIVSSWENKGQITNNENEIIKEQLSLYESKNKRKILTKRNVCTMVYQLAVQLM